MAAFNATECVYQVDADWIDRTRYVYKHGAITVLSEPLTTVGEAKAKIQKALDAFQITMPNYQLLERRNLDKPVPGAELFAHRMGNPDEMQVFEIAVFWPVGESMWVFRVQAPLAAEEACRHVMDSFFESYEPVEAS